MCIKFTVGLYHFILALHVILLYYLIIISCLFILMIAGYGIRGEYVQEYKKDRLARERQDAKKKYYTQKHKEQRQRLVSSQTENLLLEPSTP